MSQRLVVVGTGTGVGKTWLTAALATALRAAGASVVALKPVETGVSDNSADTDYSRLASASSFHVQPQPYRFVPPISPHLAARRDGQTIELQQILTYVRYHESSYSPDWTLIETAGGLFSPLGPDLTNFDLARALDPARWLLVGADALGVLHDVTATLGLARARGRTPEHLVLSAARTPDESTGSNATELQTLGIVPTAFTARRDDPASLAPLVDALLR